MPLDHYVSQVHLANFNSPARGEDGLWGIRKRDLLFFPCKTKDICRVPDGSTNAYILEPRIVEEFLLTIEPNYNRAIASFRAGIPNVDAVYVVAGFIAYVMTCSPAAMRINSVPLRAAVDATSRLLEARSDLPSPPPELGAGSLSDMLDDGRVKIKIDKKYPQAIGIDGITQRIIRFGNFTWEILHNDFKDSPFFTSDFPTAVEETADNRIMNRIVPLAPDLAVRILPDFNDPPSKLEFPGFRYRNVNLSYQGVRAINTTVVRCAEETVFFRDNHDWVSPFVKKHQVFHTSSLTDRIPMPVGGHMLIARTRVRRRPVHEEVITENGITAS